MRIRIARGFWTSRLGLALLGGVLGCSCSLHGLFTYYYVQFGHLINQRLTGQIYQNTSRVYSAPGPHLTSANRCAPSDLASYLLRAGYQESAARGFARAVSRYRLDRRDSPLRGILFPGQQRAAREFRRIAKSRTSRSSPTARSATPPKSSPN